MNYIDGGSWECMFLDHSNQIREQIRPLECLRYKAANIGIEGILCPSKNNTFLSNNNNIPLQLQEPLDEVKYSEPSDCSFEEFLVK